MESTIFFGIRKVSREDVKEEVKRLLVTIGGPVENSALKRWSYELGVLLDENAATILAWHYGRREDIPAHKLETLRNAAADKIRSDHQKKVNAEQSLQRRKCSRQRESNANAAYFWGGPEIGNR